MEVSGCATRWFRLLLCCFLLGVAGTLLGADLHYDYDETGRLIRAVSDSGTISRYEYDSVGNLLAVHVVNDTVSEPPSELGVDSLRCGESLLITLDGADLEGTRVSSSSEGLLVSNLQYTDTGLTFTLTADCANALGAQTLELSNAAGSTSISLQVTPLLPEVFITPAPFAIPPDGSKRAFLLRLSHGDLVEHIFQLASSDPDKLLVDTANLSIAPGTTEVLGQVSGRLPGQAFLEITSPTLGSDRVPVFITADFAGVNTSVARPLGVHVAQPEPPAGTSLTMLGAPQVGLALGDLVTGLEPSVLTVGSGPVILTVRGVGLAGASAVTVVPDAGLTVGNPVVSADGSLLRFPVTVDESAPTGLRRVVVKRANGSEYAAAPVMADRLRIALPVPIIHSVEPLWVRPGDESVALTIRGQRLSEAESVTIHPGEGVTVDAAPSVDGETLTTRVSIAPDAEPGPRTVVVNAPAGSSDSTPAAANTLNVVLETHGEVEDLASSALGVTKQADEEPQLQHLSLASASLGLANGTVMTGLEPAAGVLGTTVQLRVVGSGLQSVDDVELIPSDGIAVGEPEVLTDGTAVAVSLTIAPDAPVSERQLVLRAGGNAVPAAPSAASRFLVTPPAPRLDAVSPLYVQLDSASTELTLSGEHLARASVRALPSDGITVGRLEPGAEGKSLSVQLAVAANAPTGARVLELTTPGGSTTASPTPHNTVYVVAEPGPLRSGLAAPALGVTRLFDEPQAPQLLTTASASLSVTKQRKVAPDERDYEVAANTLGLAVGAVATRVEPRAALPGETVTLTIYGGDLGDIENAAASPGTGVVLSDLVVSPDGASLTVTASVDALAPPEKHSLVLKRADGSVVPFAPLTGNQFRVGYGQPEILSIEPILAGRGEARELLVRGSNLFDAGRVVVEPAAGIDVSNTLAVNDAGTDLRVRIHIHEDAPLGTRVVRVHVPGAVTSGDAKPANTLSIYESVPD